MGWGEAQEGADICILIADSHYLQHKLTQPCKAIILQLKNKLEKAKSQSCPPPQKKTETAIKKEGFIPGVMGL